MGFLEKLYLCGGEPLIAYSDVLQGALAEGPSELTQHHLDRAKQRWAAQADSVWIKALIEMHELDQSEREDPVIRDKNNVANLETLIELTEARCFPTPAKVGSSFGTVPLLLWHHIGELGDTDRLKHYVSLIREAMRTGSVQPDFLSLYSDYNARNAGLPMRYGVLLNFIRDKSDIQLVPRIELNRNRAAVGLAPIEDFAQSMGIELDTFLGK